MNMAEDTSQKLPDDCWAMIFNHIRHQSDWESISSVCKRFLSITNSSRVSVAVFSPSIQVLSRQLQRFSTLQKLQLVNFQGDLSKALSIVSESGLILQELDLSSNENLPKVSFEELGSKMKKLKVLKCSGSSLTDAELVRIANSFSQLEELQIRDSRFPQKDNDKIIAVTDEGISFLSSKLKRLRKIDISGNQCISDKSLFSLSSNCAFLEHITVGYSQGVTENGISFLVKNSRTMKSMVLCAHITLTSLGAKGCIPKSLQSLKFISVDISDEFLYSIAEAQIPLTELTLSFCKSYTFTGISKLLQSYQSLKTLVLQGADFLTNEHIEHLSPFLYNLTSVWLYSCPKLSDSAFVILTQRCPFLSYLEMGSTSLGKEEYDYDGLMKNFAIKNLHLPSNPYLNTSGLKLFLNICPNVEKLDLYNCFQHKEKLDVADILECNRKLVNLMLNACCHLNISRNCVKITMLETLVAKHSGIDNEVLSMLGRICPKLIHLDLEDCNNIAEEGVKAVVKSCSKLRYLSLSACANVDMDIISWIVKNSPSLRRLVSPSCSYPEEEKQRYFLQQGCLVRKGADYEEFI